MPECDTPVPLVDLPGEEVVVTFIGAAPDAGFHGSESETSRGTCTPTQPPQRVHRGSTFGVETYNDQPRVRANRSARPAVGASLSPCGLLGRVDAGGLRRRSALVDNSLVHQVVSTGAEHRFGMLETIREFAQQEAHAHYMSELAAESVRRLVGREQVEWIARTAREQDNFRAALGRAGAG